MGAAITKVTEWECIRAEKNFQNHLIQPPHVIDEDLGIRKSKMTYNLLSITQEVRGETNWDGDFLTPSLSHVNNTYVLWPLDTRSVSPD